MVFAVKRLMGTIDELVAMERWFGTPDPIELVARYDAALRALESEDVLVWLEDAGRAGITGDSAAHFQAHWLDGGQLPGIDRKTLETALRAGFTAALTEARDNALPTSILWVAHGDSFTVEHVLGANAVTVVLFVPESVLDGANLTGS